MAVKYFENMSSGMAAKLATRYRVRNTPALAFTRSAGNKSGGGSHKDWFEKVGRTVATRNI